MNVGVAYCLIFLMLLLAVCWLFRKRVRRNRWRRSTAWTSGRCHPSYWNNDTRGHTQSR